MRRRAAATHRPHQLAGARSGAGVSAGGVPGRGRGRGGRRQAPPRRESVLARDRRHDVGDSVRLVIASLHWDRPGRQASRGFASRCGPGL